MSQRGNYTSPWSENAVLNMQEANKEKACHNCGRKFPDTILNIEAVIHHNAKNYVCLDLEACKKAAKKRRKS